MGIPDSIFSGNALGRRGKLAVEGQTLPASRDRNLLAVLDLSGKDHFGERVLHFLLDDALERPRSISRVIALVGKPFACAGIELDRNLAILEQPCQPLDLDVDDRAHM